MGWDLGQGQNKNDVLWRTESETLRARKKYLRARATVSSVALAKLEARANVLGFLKLSTDFSINVHSSTHSPRP